MITSLFNGVAANFVLNVIFTTQQSTRGAGLLSQLKSISNPKGRVFYFQKITKVKINK